MPLAAVIAPGSLTVAPVHTVQTVALQVPQPAFSDLANFGYIDIHQTLVTAPRMYRLAYQVASSGQPVPLASTFANETYHIFFDGPAIKCASASEHIIANLTETFGISQGLSMRGSDLRFYSWIPDKDMNYPADMNSVLTLDYKSRDVSRIFVLTNTGFWNKTRTDIRKHYPPRQVNVTECSLFNASYSVHYTFQYPNQTRRVSIDEWRNPVRLYDIVNPSETRFSEGGEAVHDTPDGSVVNPMVPFSAKDAQVSSYGTVMQAFSTLLIGRSSNDRYNGDTTDHTSWKIIDIDWSDGSVVQRGLEQLFQNITLSVLSDQGLM